MRDPKPRIPQRQSIGEYHPYELVSLIEWICSDGQLRTDDEIRSEMVSVLGFTRRGVRIDEAIRNAIRNFRATSQPDLNS